MNLLHQKRVLILVCLLSCSAFIVGCGKKPAEVKAPPHVTQDVYPQQAYPAQDPFSEI